MRTYDFSPLWRSTIGFDRLFDLAEMAQRAGEDNWVTVKTTFETAWTELRHALGPQG